MEPNIYYSNDDETYIIHSPAKNAYTMCIDTNTFEMVVRLQRFYPEEYFGFYVIPVASPSFPIIVN